MYKQVMVSVFIAGSLARAIYAHAVFRDYAVFGLRFAFQNALHFVALRIINEDYVIHRYKDKPDNSDPDKEAAGPAR